MTSFFVFVVWVHDSFSICSPKSVSLYDPGGGDVVLTAEQVRECLHRMSKMTEAGKRLWLTTREMGFALEREDNEMVEARDHND